MKPVLRVQLSLMMFLEYFIKGAWFVTLGTYLIKSLNASGMEVANIFATQSLGAVFAPFFVGFVADRYFNAERVQLCISLELDYFTGCLKHLMQHIFIPMCLFTLWLTCLRYPCPME
jgi:MFS family permease